jgi:hypothetical protein
MDAADAAAATTASYVADAMRESALARWHDYALASITPQFSWALRPTDFGPPRVLDNYNGEVRATMRFGPRGTSSTEVGVSVATGNVGDTPGVVPAQNSHFNRLPEPGLQRTVVAPSLAREWGDHGTVRLTGVLAYQRFASLGMGADGERWGPVPTYWRDSSYGVGARFDVGKASTENARWDVSYQSRVGMGVFANYRGVFADAGSFDIPASAAASFGYALTPNFSIDLGVQRVQYSAIRPFTSANLPTRFLALLGDSSSPVFRWSDLNVYSIGGSLHADDFGNLQLRYTTRQQPVPTSRLLERALAPATANGMFSLSWTRAFGANASLDLSASYATSSYYLLMPTYVQHQDGTANQFEFEGVWSIRF